MVSLSWRKLRFGNLRSSLSSMTVITTHSEIAQHRMIVLNMGIWPSNARISSQIVWWRLKVFDGSFLLITLTKPEKPQGSLKVVMVSSLWKESQSHSLSWQTYLERQVAPKCRTLTVWEHWPGSRCPGTRTSYLGTFMQTDTCRHRHTHTRSHKKNWGGRCTAASISKWPLIIVAVLEQC